MPEQSSPKHNWKSFFRDHLLLKLSVLIAFFVFFKNAWVTEDSFILFRSLDQLAIGNGPIWNPHERVQVFTSPLWYWLQAIIRPFSSHVYFNVIAISLVLWSGTLLVLRKQLKDNFIFLLSILFFTASTAFFDYTTSGLENVLAYCLIAISLDRYSNLFLSQKKQDREEKETDRKNIKILLITLGLLICTRHDLALLFSPSVIYIFWKKYKCFSIKEWLSLSAIALTPFIAWTIFSLLYYGFPFPNTAYAKLNTGIAKRDLLAQGINYFRSSLKLDTITIPLIAFFTIGSFSNWFGKHVKPLACGVVLNLMYVTYVGGDFMQGRFFSYSYMVAVVVFLIRAQTLRFDLKKPLAVLLGLYFIVFPHTPLTSPINYSKPTFDEAVFLGIADERAFYSGDLSIFNYTKFTSQNADTHAPSIPQQLKQLGLSFKDSDETIRQTGNIGIYGYWLGTDKIIVDKSALSDPLLARLPSNAINRAWRPGHYPRDVPQGYLQSIESNQALIEDPQINQLYKQLKLVTQSPDLFTWERLKAIVALNSK